MTPRPVAWVSIALLAFAPDGVGVAPARAEARAPIDVECVWSAIPQSARDALLAAAPDQLGAAVQSQAPVLGAAGIRCHVAGDDGPRFAKAIYAKTVAVWSAAQLSKLASIDDATLTRAWESLPTSERAAFAHEVENGLRASPAEAAELRKAAADIGVHDDPGLRYVSYYFAARALLADLAGLP